MTTLAHQTPQELANAIHTPTPWIWETLVVGVGFVALVGMAFMWVDILTF